MDPLELYARARDGGAWLELAADGWRLVTGLVLLGFVIVLILIVSTRAGSFAGQLLSALRRPVADHLFMRVSFRGLGPGPKAVGEKQAYLSGLRSHQITLYAHFPASPGEVARIEPPGVNMVVTGLRKVSDEPPWFAIEAEPLFRDDGSRSRYRKFIGGISDVTYRYRVFPDSLPRIGFLPARLWPHADWRPLPWWNHDHS